MILLEAEDQQGNKAKIEVTQFKTFADALKEIQRLNNKVIELTDEINKLKSELK